MEAFLHQVLGGLATGGIYASVALALVMIHQATHLLNFAQGEMAMFSTYIAWALINAGVPYWAAFFMRQAANLKNFDTGLALPGIRINTSPKDFAPIEAVQLMRFDGKSWVRFGNVISNDAQ